MLGRRLIFALFLVFIMACSPEGTKVYKVDYKGNYREGAFRAVIGNDTIFTNGHGIAEISVKNKPDFFCYAVNKEVLCKLKVDIKVSDDAAEKFRIATQNLKELLLKSGKKSSVLPERLVYYINNEKLEEELLLVNDLQNKSVNVLHVTISGKGPTENEASKNAVKISKEAVNILADRK